MRKKCFINYIIIIFTLFIIGQLKVDAGICNGLKNQEYCNSPTGVFYIKQDVSDLSWRTTENGYFMRPGYTADIYGNYPAFCLDPGLSFPNKVYLNKVRELDINQNYDDGVYRIYQKLVNDTMANSSDVLSYRSYFQFAIRAWTLKNGYGYVNSSDAKYKYDASNFARCVKDYLDSTLDMTKLHTLTSGECGLSKNFGNDYQKNMVSAYYNMVGKNYLWKNPLEKESNIWYEVTNPTEDDQNYKVEFKVRFVDESNFYNYYTAVPSLNLSEANFEGYISINGQDCIDGSPCDANVWNHVGYVHPKYSNVQDVVTFSISFTPEQYQKYFPDGNGTITFKYKYNHPMNVENIFVTRYDVYNATYQRMVVIKDYTHYGEKTLTIGSPIIEKKYCEHTSTGYTDSNGNIVSTIEQFLNSCSCDDVNTSILTEAEETIYNAKCRTSIVNNNFTGGIYDCKSSTYTDVSTDTNYESYTLGYSKDETVNEYCTETCTETIDVMNLKGKFQTEAGKYFEFTRYPELVAEKNCIVNIDYNSWKSDYKSKLETMVNAYNTWQYNANMTITTGDCNCRLVCGEYSCHTECDTLYKYSYSYTKVLVNSDGITLSTTTDSGTLPSTCNYSLSFDAAGTKTTFQNTTTSIPELQNKLKACNKKVFEITNDEDYYDFEYELKYYYSQTYADTKVGTNGLIWNNERTSYGGIDDSAYKIDYSVEPSGGNNLNSTNELRYDTINSSGTIKSENILTQSNVSRYVKYNVKYSPGTRKYYNSYTGEITLTPMVDAAGNLTNSALLGPLSSDGFVYDTHVSAMPGKNNTTRYVFAKLGSSSNEIYNNFKTSSAGIIRECSYEITEGIMEEKKPNFVYRIVDPNNVDPNDRLNTGNGFKNWTEEDIKAIEDADTYNPDNLQYSFTLNSTTIKEIREYNTGKKYSDSDTLKCKNAEKCESSFVTTYAKDTRGRNIWD